MANTSHGEKNYIQQKYLAYQVFDEESTFKTILSTFFFFLHIRQECRLCF